MEALEKIKLRVQSECNPSDPMMTPTRPGMFDFTQWGTSCRQGTVCPYTSTPHFDQNGNGNYASLSVSRQPCPVKSFCPMGMKQNCPPGFTCGEQGLETPNRCVPKQGFTCYTKHTGLAEPQPCEKGNMCVVPYLPPLPVPPGYYDATPSDAYNNGSQQILAECPLGSYCNLGCTLEALNDTCACPVDTSCPGTTVVVPFPCLAHHHSGDVWDCDATGRKQNPPLCKAGEAPYCPKYSYEKYPLCEAGYYCPGPGTTIKCAKSYYCPAGTIFQALCPPGYYCPDPNQKHICPSGSYCIYPSTQPQDCSLLEVCNEGSTEPLTLAPFIILFLVLLSLFGCWKLYQYLRGEHRKATNEALSVMSERKRQSKVGGGNLDVSGYQGP